MLLPLHRSDGSLVTIACEQCGRASSAYCTKHKQIHQGFEDGSTACLPCVEELVSAAKENTSNILSSILGSISEEEVRELVEAAGASSILMGGTGGGMAVLRFVASKAVRTHQSLTQVVKEIVRRRSVDYILS